MGEILHEDGVRMLEDEEEGKKHWGGMVTSLGEMNALLKRFDHI